MDVTTVDAMIALVAERPTIWNKRNQNHSCRLEVEKCWKEIGAALKVDENNLRRKWKYLRDQFCVELGKVQKSTSGTSKWRHYRALEFLKCTVTARVYSKGDDDYQDDSDNLEIDEQSSSDYFERLSPKVEVKKKLPKQESAKKKKKKTVKAKSIASVQDNDSVRDKYVFEEEDEHFHFFKSVIPHVRKIPESKLLAFRGRIQSLVEEFAYGPNPTSTEFVVELPGFPIKGSPPRYSSEACDPIDTSD